MYNMQPKELKDMDATPQFLRGEKVVFEGKETEVVNLFPLNETEYIYKLKNFGGSRWIEGKFLEKK